MSHLPVMLTKITSFKGYIKHHLCQKPASDSSLPPINAIFPSLHALSLSNSLLALPLLYYSYLAILLKIKVLAVWNLV